MALSTLSNENSLVRTLNGNEPSRFSFLILSDDQLSSLTQCEEYDCQVTGWDKSADFLMAASRLQSAFKSSEKKFLRQFREESPSLGTLMESLTRACRENMNSVLLVDHQKNDPKDTRSFLFLRRLCDQCPDLPLIILIEQHDGFASVREELACIFEDRGGLDGIVTKPFREQVIKDKIRDILDPSSVRNMSYMARLAIEMDNLTVARKLIRDIRNRHEDVIACTLSGDIEFKQGKAHMASGGDGINRSIAHLKTALYYYQEALKKNPNAIVPLNRVKEVYQLIQPHLKGKEEQGLNSILKCLERLNQINGLNAERHLETGKVYLDLDRDQDAMSSFNRAEVACAKVTTGQSLARSYSSICQEISSTLRDCAEKREAQGRDVSHLKAKADAYQDKHQTMAAKIKPAKPSGPLTQGLSLPAEIQRLNRLGLQARRENRLEEAVKHFREALAKANVINDLSALAGLHYNLALTHNYAKSNFKALSSIQEALRLKDDFFEGRTDADEVQVNIAGIFFLCGKMEKARSIVEKILAKRPFHKASKDLLSQMEGK